MIRTCSSGLATFGVGLTNSTDRWQFPWTAQAWWSRKDLGALEWLGFGLPKQREETLLNVVARKPALV